MRVLVTNDDGFDAPGLAVLARAFADAGHDVIVVAPLEQASGASAGIGPVHLREHGIRAETVTPVGLDGIEVIAADALPALIVITACLGGFGPLPDIVVSGINPGRNVGRAVLHSGTVGAALTAGQFGVKALATSIQAGAVPSSYEFADGSKMHFESVARLAVALASELEKGPERTVLNLNVPNRPLGEIRGIRRAHLANSGLNFLGSVQNRPPATQPDLVTQPTADSNTRSEDSDDALTELGWAVVTPLVSVREDRRDEVAEFVAHALDSLSGLIGS
jgi:5'-nucleotidase